MRAVICAALLCAFAAAPAAATPNGVGAPAAAPALLLAENYFAQPETLDLTPYWASEKLDGVRARWDGARLISRRGNVFAAPEWFTAGFPQMPLDGELWGRNLPFERIVSVVRRAKPHAGWREIRFMVFDAPQAGSAFGARVALLQKLSAAAEAAGNSYLKMAPQFRVQNRAQLLQKLDAVTAAGGEGLMLHHEDALYRGGRSKSLLKVKRFQDAEAVVVAHHPGRGRLQGMLGAVEVRLPNGARFRIGSGFSDVERRAPPPIGATVTFRHQGFTAKGIPRFPVFWRVRPAESPAQNPAP